MQKPNLYLSLLFLLILGITFISSYDIYESEYKRGKESLSKETTHFNYSHENIEHIEKNLSTDYLILVPDEESGCLLCGIDQIRGMVNYHLSCNTIKCEDYNIELLLAFNREDFSKSLFYQKDTILSKGALKVLESKNSLKVIHFERNNFEPSRSLFDFIDSSFFIFILIAIIYFLVTTFLQFVSKILGINNNKLSYIFKFLLLLGCGIFLFSTSTFRVDEVLARFSFLMIPLFITPFLIFQHIIKDKTKELRFDLSESIKFISIMILTTVILFSPFMFGFIDLLDFKIIVLKFILAFSFSIALGNLMVNIKDHVLELRKNESKIKSLTLANKSSQSQLNALQASVNPHFLYNALNAIAGLAQSDPDKTETLAIKLSEFYKYTTNRNATHIVSLKEELEMLDNYLKIEIIRFGDILQFEKEIDPFSLNAQLPRFVLQPLLENAIKYGHNGADIKAKLETSLIGNKLVIKLYDSGQPFNEQLDKGFGLRSVFEKSELLFPNKHSIKFNNLPSKHIDISYEQ